MHPPRHEWPFGLRSVHALVFAFLCSTSAGLAQGQTTVFHGGILIDGTGSPPLRDAVIVVNDSIIACVGPRTACSSYLERDGIKLVDVSGKWIIPGLIDVHVHLTSPCCQLTDPPEQRLLALLRAGVTTVRDVGAWADSGQSSVTYAFGHGQVERMAALVERVTRSSPPGPRIRYCGPGLYSSDNTTAPRPSVNNYIRLRSGGDVGEVVRYLVDRGASCIKLFSSASPRHMQEVLAAAARGVPGIGHSSVDVPLGVQLEWLWAEIHHFWFPSEDLLPPERRTRLPESQWARMYVGRARFDPAAHEAAALAAKVAQRRVAWVPTLAIRGHGCSTLCWDLIRTRAGPGDSTLVREAVFDPARPPGSLADSSAAMRAVNVRFVNQWVALLHTAGVTILAGSDSPQPGVALGTALHSELEYLVAAGLSPVEALAAATRNAAAALGLGDRLGTVSTGKLADFVVLAADPLVDIRNTRAIRFVVFGGAVIDVESDAPER